MSLGTSRAEPCLFEHIHSTWRVTAEQRTMGWHSDPCMACGEAPSGTVSTFIEALSRVVSSVIGHCHATTILSVICCSFH